MEKYTVEQDVCFFDAETTGLADKLRWDKDFDLFPNLVSLSWILNGVEKNYIIYPDGWTIPKEATEIHGITTQYALENGTKLEIVIADFAEDILHSTFVSAHNIYFDSSVIKANVLKHLGQSFYDEYKIEEGLYKGKRVDTMMKTIKFVGAPYPSGRKGNKFPSLLELFAKLFPGETFEAHNSLEDCRALKRCLPVLIDLGIIELKIKQYDGEQLDLKNDMDKAKLPPIENKIEFIDPSPVVIPGANGENIPEPEKTVVGNYEKALKTEKGLKATERPGKSPLLDIDEF